MDVRLQPSSTAQGTRLPAASAHATLIQMPLRTPAITGPTLGEAYIIGLENFPCQSKNDLCDRNTLAVTCARNRDELTAQPCTAAIPGSTLPSRYSSMAPPPVLT